MILDWYCTDTVLVLDWYYTCTSPDLQLHSKGTTPVPHWRRTGTTAVQRWHYTGTALALQWHYADTVLVLKPILVALVLHRYETGPAVVPHWCCTGGAVVLYWHYSGTALWGVESDCTTAATPAKCRRTTRASPVHQPRPTSKRDPRQFQVLGELRGLGTRWPPLPRIPMKSTRAGRKKRPEVRRCVAQSSGRVRPHRAAIRPAPQNPAPGASETPVAPMIARLRALRGRTLSGFVGSRVVSEPGKLGSSLASSVSCQCHLG